MLSHQDNNPSSSVQKLKDKARLHIKMAFAELNEMSKIQKIIEEYKLYLQIYPGLMDQVSKNSIVLLDQHHSKIVSLIQIIADEMTNEADCKEHFYSVCDLRAQIQQSIYDLVNEFTKILEAASSNKNFNTTKRELLSNYGVCLEDIKALMQDMLSPENDSSFKDEIIQLLRDANDDGIKAANYKAYELFKKDQRQITEQDVEAYIQALLIETENLTALIRIMTKVVTETISQKYDKTFPKDLVERLIEKSYGETISTLISMSPQHCCSNQGSLTKQEMENIETLVDRTKIEERITSYTSFGLFLAAQKTGAQEVPQLPAIPELDKTHLTELYKIIAGILEKNIPSQHENYRVHLEKVKKETEESFAMINLKDIQIQSTGFSPEELIRLKAFAELTVELKTRSHEYNQMTDILKEQASLAIEIIKKLSHEVPLQTLTSYLGALSEEYEVSMIRKVIQTFMIVSKDFREGYNQCIDNQANKNKTSVEMNNRYQQ